MRKVESGHIEYEEFKEDFLGKYILSLKKEVKVKKIINLSQCNMTVEEYSLTKYSLSLVSNPIDKKSCFVTGVADLVK